MLNKLILSLALTYSLACAAESMPRTRELFDFDWRFVKSGKMNGFRPLGVGWYRKSFVTPEAKCVRLEFEGVFREAKVWVNGAPTRGEPWSWCEAVVNLVKSRFRRQPKTWSRPC